MAVYNRKDHFYEKAKKEGKASRAIYKIEEIHKKYRILRKKDLVLDLGCAPGGWLQFLSETVGPEGKVIGIDRAPIHIPLKSNTVFIQKNIEEGLKEELAPLLKIKKADVLVSDMAPDTSGIPFRDSYLSYELIQMVWKVTPFVLKTGGNFVVKVFPGKEADELLKIVRKHFDLFKVFIPESTRKTSIEVYWVGLKFRPTI